MKKLVKINFGERLKALRISSGLSQAEFAAAIGLLSGKSLWDYEKGNEIPTRKRQIEIAKVFGISVDELMNSALLPCEIEKINIYRRNCFMSLGQISQKIADAGKSIELLNNKRELSDIDKLEIKRLEDEMAMRIALASDVISSLLTKEGLAQSKAIKFLGHVPQFVNENQKINGTDKIIKNMEAKK